MRNHTYLALLCVSLLALAACGSTPASTPSPTATTAPAQPSPTNTPSASFQTYTSPGHKYQISYPAGWQQQTADGNPEKSSFSGPDNQTLEVSDTASTGSDDPAQMVNDYCGAIQPGIAANPVETTAVTIAGQTWTKGDCDAGTQSTTDLIVELVIYKGAVYQIDYGSPLANFQADVDAYYSPMEQSFTFLS